VKKTPAMTWTIALQRIDAPQNPDALADVHPLLDRLVRAFGPRPLSRLLDVRPGSVANWMSGHRRISGEMARRIIDLHDILNRALQVFPPSTAARWLVGNEPFLDNKRPIDVLALRGAAPLIEALDNIDVGAYA
jgi:uncharacterized protein (DUF2384 family)